MVASSVQPARRELRYTPGATLSATIARRRAGIVDGTHDSTEVMALVVLRFGAVVGVMNLSSWWEQNLAMLSHPFQSHTQIQKPAESLFSSTRHIAGMYSLVTKIMKVVYGS